MDIPSAILQLKKLIPPTKTFDDYYLFILQDIYNEVKVNKNYSINYPYDALFNAEIGDQIITSLQNDIGPGLKAISNDGKLSIQVLKKSL